MKKKEEEEVELLALFFLQYPPSPPFFFTVWFPPTLLESAFVYPDDHMVFLFQEVLNHFSSWCTTCTSNCSAGHFKLD